MSDDIRILCELKEQMEMKRDGAIAVRDGYPIDTPRWYYHDGRRQAYTDLVIQLRDELQ